MTRRVKRSAGIWAAVAILVVAAAVAGGGRVLRGMRTDLARRAIPALPDLAGHNDDTARLLREADEAARRHPSSVEAIGRLAMLYHAHQFYDAAARLYSFLGDRAPADFRWPYFHGVLEEERHNPARAMPLYEAATRIDPGEADAWARLGLLLIGAQRLPEARGALEKAAAIDPLHPLAGLGLARLAANDRDWEEVVGILEPIIAAHPLFSDAHKEIGRAYALLQRGDEAAVHQEKGAFGDPVDSPRLESLYALAVPAILGGDASKGRALIETRCQRCHTLDRTFSRPDKSHEWWAGTVRRMQRLAGKSLITDEEAAHIAAYLASPRPVVAP